MKSRGTLAGACLIAVVSALALAPSFALADPSNVSVLFYRGQLNYSESKAGEHVGYGVTFTTSAGIDNGTVVTIDTASGTQLPTGANSYTFITSNPVGSCTASSVNRVIPEAAQVTSGCTAAANSSVSLLIGRGSGTTGGGVTNPTTAGSKSLTVQTSKETGTGTGNYTISPDVPANIDINSGNSQEALVGTAFANPISVKVTDQYGNANPGLQVDFGLPTDSSQPTGSFPGPASTASDTTNSDGVATSPTITANTVAGLWNPTAQLHNGSLSVRLFAETNDLGPAPDLTIDSHPDPIINVDTASVAFHSSDSNATFTCTLDSETAADCTSPYTRDSLSEGPHSIAVTPVDPLDNPAAPTVESFIVDTHSPSVTIKGPSKTKDRTPTFKISSNEDDTTFQCKLDDKGYKDCGAKYTTPKLKPGRHRLTVRVTDAASNTATAKKKIKILD